MPNLRPFVTALQLYMILFCYVQNLLMYISFTKSEKNQRSERS